MVTLCYCNLKKHSNVCFVPLPDFLKLCWSKAAGLVLVGEEKPVSVHQFFELQGFDAVEGGTSQSAPHWGLSLPEPVKMQQFFFL